MKRILVLAILALSVGISASAETVLVEYRGTKARDSYKNPCKGETIRVCGKVTKEIEIQQGFAMVRETVMDNEGRVLSRSSYRTMESPETVVTQILTSVPQNATATIISDNEEIPED